MKENQIESVLNDWVGHLPFTQQAVLLVSLRGPDGLSKWCSVKPVVFFIRGVILKPAYPFNPETDTDGFMRADFNNFESTAGYFFDDMDFYPYHFLIHLIHACEIIGYSHPVPEVADHFERFYKYACKSLHMQPESSEQLFKRLSK